MSGSQRGFSWKFILLALWISAIGLKLSLGATPEEIESLRTVATDFGIAPGTWNFSTDPCVAGWKGVLCCTGNNSLVDAESCCAIPRALYPPASLVCARTANASVSMLILRSDLFGQILHGTLSPALCGLSSLTVLDLGLHRLSGQVPACIGTNLTNLVILRIGDNSLTGGIPPELGGLSSLEQLYLDVTNISGKIPPSLGGMSSLVILNLRSNALEGEIPPELGRLISLTDVELQVNRLTGGIPSTFSNLSSLVTFKAFNNELSGQVDNSIFQSPSLKTLDLRRNNLTGPIPALGSSQLEEINLGFNRFSGGIPSSLGSIQGLRRLFLDHNMLNGTIPGSFTSLASLALLDLSHNMLTGTLDSLSNLGATTLQGPPQVDISFNNFNTSSVPAYVQSTVSPPPGVRNPYFNCIPSSGSTNTCSRTSPGSNLFYAVNIGGESVTSTSSDSGVRLSFTSDTDSAAANQSVRFFHGRGSSQSPWGLELSGNEAGTYQRDDQTLNMSRAGGADRELYTTLRWSSSYIAFHADELRSPGNYTLTLHFAELVFDQPGYRTFDVIVQGEVVKERLDIVREVGPRAAYRISRNITVVDGSVSVELVYSGPDRFLVAGQWAILSMGPVLSAVSVVSVEYRGETGRSGLSTGAIVGISTGSILGLIAVILLAGLFAWRRRRSRRRKLKPTVISHSHRSIDVAGAMTYEELYEATEGFKHKLGQGGFGAVYRGTLASGNVVAVKQLLKQNQAQVEEDFKKEISIISKVRHRNLLAVIGYSLDTDVPMLVCEYIPNGSLDKWLFRRREETTPMSFLSWESRQKIATEVACGLAYLHDESEHKIIHCDVKPANILLDSDFTPRIGDFGLARLYDEKESHVTATRLKGTAGYLAPEYAMHLQLSDKVDVYSFGVVLLELLTGRRAVEMAAPSEQIVLVDWAHKEAQVPTNMLEIMDERLKGQYVEQEAKDMTTIAILCTQRAPSLRPKMQTVWLMLNGTVKVPDFLENLNSVILLGGSEDSSSSTGRLRSSEDSSMSAGFISLRVFPGTSLSSLPEKPATY